MNTSDVQEMFLQRLGLRIGPHMAAYVLGRISSPDPSMAIGALPVIAGDARTGEPVRQIVDVFSIVGSDPAHVTAR